MNMRHRAIPNIPKWWKELRLLCQTPIGENSSCHSIVVWPWACHWASLSNNLLLKWIFPLESGKGECPFKSIARLRDVVPKHPTRVSQSRCSINGKIPTFNNLLNVSVSLHTFTVTLCIWHTPPRPLRQQLRGPDHPGRCSGSAALLLRRGSHSFLRTMKASRRSSKAQ